MTKSSPFARYVRADQPVKQRIIAASFGKPGTGKTTFWLGAPAPIVIFSLDMGLEGVVEAFQDEKEIYVSEYDWSGVDKDDVDALQTQAIELRDKFIDDFEHAVQNARTVLIDKETDMWELFRYAEFGAPNDNPRNYPALNQRMRRLINMPKALDLNFGVVQGMKDEWVSQINKKTGAKGAVGSGNQIRAGFSEIEGLVHINIEHVREDGEFRMRIGKARGPGGHDIQDQELPGMTFAEFGTLAFPDSQISDWE